ncbi:acyl-CoA dehydrogenase family protein [Paraherbaspirillum soli]|uniref:Acyl-CoA dehydrogenase family protein n=1 Tax=Paraherbaspirillum soli TaxID=631222 RepID=A0ABW0MF64_9BURK
MSMPALLTAAPPQWSALDALESLLQAQDQAGRPFSPAACAELDRLEQFPAAACRLLDAFGLHRHYVPRRHGGLMADHAELVQLWRAVARRDLTIAVGHGKTFLGAACVWVAADSEQARRLAQEIAAGAVVSWGLTERQHGSDLLAGELAASKTDDGWRVNGEKWLINNATRGQLLCALARTDPAGGPRGFSLLLIDKRQLTETEYRCLPKERTHGIRGADISGIAYQDAQVPDRALVGQAGQGIEIVLKALQLSRTTCVALSLGAADHALQLALDFAAQRILYERRLIALPLVRRIFGEVTASLLTAEVVSVVASRCIHALPGEMSVVSALTKAFVPSTIDQVLTQLGDLIGARAFLSEEHAHGMFQKIERDHRIVAIFDGSTVVNRNALINQFRGLARAYHGQHWEREGLTQAVNLAAALPEFAPQRLRLVSAGGCSVLQSLPAAVAQLGDLPAAVLRLAARLDRAAAALMQELAAYQPAPREVPPQAFELARRYELCFAGAACVQFWLANRAALSNPPLWRNGLWLQACLLRILEQLDPGAIQDEDEDEEDDGDIYAGLTDCIAPNSGSGRIRVSLLPDAAWES